MGDFVNDDRTKDWSAKYRKIYHSIGWKLHHGESYWLISECHYLTFLLNSKSNKRLSITSLNNLVFVQNFKDFFDRKDIDNMCFVEGNIDTFDPSIKRNQWKYLVTTEPKKCSCLMKCYWHPIRKTIMLHLTVY